MMTFSYCRPVRRVVQTTLLLAGLSLTVSPELLAEESSEEGPQSSEQEPAQDPPEEAPTEPLPPTGASDWEADLDAMIEEAKRRALENREDRAAGVGSESQETEDRLEESAEESPADSRPSGLNGGALSSAAITLGAGGGLVAGYIGGATVCELAGYGGGLWGLGCFIETPEVFRVSVLTGIVGGTLGYKNSRLALTLGGAFTGFGVGGILMIDADERLLLAGSLLTGAGGAALGHHIWKARDARLRRVAVSPFWDEETSGVVLLGEF